MDIGSILRWIIHAIVFLLSAAYGMGMYVDCRLGSRFVPTDIQALKGQGQVHFVAFSDFPLSTLNDLARYYHDKYGFRFGSSRIYRSRSRRTIRTGISTWRSDWLRRCTA